MYDQSIARLNRPGQSDHVTFAHLIAEGTIDCEIYEAFEEGRDLVQAVLNGIKRCGT
jgi:SNF2 family DNA or RNA helicase